MRTLLAGAAVLAVTTWSGVAFSQPPAWGPVNPSADQARLPPPVIPPAGARTGEAADVNAVEPGLAEGLRVTDRDGRAVGRIARLATNDDGRQVATIRMGSRTYTLQADELAVRDGVAVVDSTRDELLGRMGDSGP
jgi:hypothetical protein